uniref:SS18 subunit of BAF chromatin remodeling complex n=1 Tax=Paramormyrops kingsleyae TaxID=1676925 RepID=A0A3B3TAV5_9TELE
LSVFCLCFKQRNFVEIASICMHFSKCMSAICVSLVNRYQQMLHRNLVYLATIADSNQNMQSLLPAPPTQNMPMGPGGMTQSGPPHPSHGHGMPAEGPPATHMQNQMNGQMSGPMMHQQPPSQQYNMAPGGAAHYQGQQNPMAMMGQVGQGNHVMGQRPMLPYRPPQQGPPQQYASQEDYYGEQYSHGGQGTPEGGLLWPDPDGHNDYGFQQPSYPEQGYDKPYEEPSQHYYDGGIYIPSCKRIHHERQDTKPTHMSFPCDVTPVGPSQGAPGQYPGYSQGQGQQYAGYRPPQPGPPPAQQQRPYGYDQVRRETGSRVCCECFVGLGPH